MFRFTAVSLILIAATTSAESQVSKQSAGEIPGTIKSVDTKKKQFVIVLADKSEKTFLVDKGTKFLGPRGAEHEDGLHDEGMAKGSQVRVVPAADANLAKEVRLSERKAGKDKK